MNAARTQSLIGPVFFMFAWFGAFGWMILSVG